MFTSRKMFKWYGLVVVATMSAVMGLNIIRNRPSVATAQEKEKRTISELHYHPKDAILPVKIGAKVKGKAVKLGSMFEEGNKFLEKPVKPEEEFEEEDNNFIESTTFEITNLTEKKIVFLRLMIQLYTKEAVKKRSFSTAFVLDFGPPETEDGPRGYIDPGETKFISIPNRIKQDLRNEISRQESEIVRVGVYAKLIAFEDDSTWESYTGKYTPRIGTKQSKLKETGSQNIATKLTNTSIFDLPTIFLPAYQKKVSVMDQLL